MHLRMRRWPWRRERGRRQWRCKRGRAGKFKAKVLQEATREPARRRTCWRMRAVQKGTVALGDAAGGRVRHAFEDAGNGRGAERGGDKNSGAREGELSDVRRRCHKRQHASRRRVERRRRCDKMRRNNQPALTKRGGQGWTRQVAMQQRRCKKEAA